MNQFAYAVRRGFGWPVMAGCMLDIGTGRSSARASAETRVIDIHEALDDFGSGGIIELRLDHIPFPAKVFLERKDVLGASPWSSEPVGIIAVSPSLLYAATMDESKMQEFFRFRVQPLDIIVSEDVDGFHIELGADTPIEDVFAVFAMQGITIPSVPPPYDPEDVQDPAPPGSVTWPLEGTSFILGPLPGMALRSPGRHRRLKTTLVFSDAISQRRSIKARSMIHTRFRATAGPAGSRTAGTATAFRGFPSTSVFHPIPREET
jgi:hypothetical protein